MFHLVDKSIADIEQKVSFHVLKLTCKLAIDTFMQFILLEIDLGISAHDGILRINVLVKIS